MQLRFASFAVANSREDFHLQDRAHAGRTTIKNRPEGRFLLVPGETQPILKASESDFELRATLTGCW